MNRVTLKLEKDQDVKILLDVRYNKFTVQIREKGVVVDKPAVYEEHIIEENQNFDEQPYILEALRKYYKMKHIETKCLEVLSKYDKKETIDIDIS